MAKRIFVTATNTNIGKTYTTKLLLENYAKKGFNVGVIKPIETGVLDIAPDGEQLLACVKKLNFKFETLSVDDIVPIKYKLPAAPFVASNKKKLDIEALERSIKKIDSICDILIIEGAGGLYVPIDEHYMMIDLIKYFKAIAVLVTHCSLGCINDTLLSEKALKDNGISFITVFNCKDKDKNFQEVSQPYFIQSKIKVLKLDKDVDTICDVLYNL